MSVVLALDPGLSLGWALSTGKVGHYSIAAPHAEKNMAQCEREGHRGWRFSQWLGDLIVEHDVDYIAIEDNLNISKGHARTSQTFIRGWTATIAYGHGKTMIAVTPNDWEPWAKRHINWHKMEGPEGDINDARGILAYVLATTVGIDV